ncbi:MAG: Lrp/AsnC family transcriptional regulator [Anaerolineales bacterium]|uniref:Lrp/AsnC family transcriptional regulator n=1 Tax=Candidatus Desulfolinea nitratireducens TaxID=2841698 RepID=A0A8J6NL77_9CHLR|nr:Lrp/AsnC family transcriptional regulator [Candidatus Desulfolinea nitratireducens]MBL6960204.1 Lrp/AsnC family transcriptional regulator [Anaerolineales bacterium]
MLDNLDKIILRELQLDARVSNADLARSVGLSPSATLTRVKRLEESEYIKGYATEINRQQIGYDLLCFVSVSLQRHQVSQVENFHEAIQGMPEVLECHHLTGDHDYLLKVVAKNTVDLEHFLVHRLTPIDGVDRIHTRVVLSEVKSSSAIPIP